MAWLCVEWTNKKYVYVCACAASLGRSISRGLRLSASQKKMIKKDSKREVKQTWFYLHMLAASEASDTETQEVTVKGISNTSYKKTK